MQMAICHVMRRELLSQNFTCVDLLHQWSETNRTHGRQLMGYEVYVNMCCLKWGCSKHAIICNGLWRHSELQEVWNQWSSFTMKPFLRILLYCDFFSDSFMYLQFWWVFQWDVLKWKINLDTFCLNNEYLFSSCSSRLRYVAISSSSFILVFRRISCSWSCFSIPLLTSSSSFSKHSISASKFCSCMWYCCSVARNERSKPFSCEI